MIIKVRVPNDFNLTGKSPIWIRRGVSNVEYLATDVEIVSPEMSEKEILLSKVFGTGFSQPFKEVMAALINKVYGESK